MFAWSASDLRGVSRDIIEHKLDIDPKIRPKKQKLRKMSDDKVAAVKAEVQRLLDAKVIDDAANSQMMSFGLLLRVSPNMDEKVR